jgi:RNA polymerase sigma factor (sigma-70 family)
MVVTMADTAATMEAATARSLSPSAGCLDAEAAGAYVGELFAEHGRMVLGLARLLLRDPVEAEDAAQQVFLSAHQAVLRGSLPRDRAPWLAAITRNECRARVRARMREPLALRELPSDLPDPLAAAIRSADLQGVWAALAALPRRQRRALVLREVGGLSYHELGRALGVSHSAVESLLFRARRQVRALVAGTNARFAALPVAWKVAGAAVSVGIVATGASGVHSVPAPRVLAPAPPRNAQQTVTSARPLQVQELPAAHQARTVPVGVRRRRGEMERGRHHHQASDRAGGAESADTAEPAEQETIEEHVDQASEGPGPAPQEPAQLEATQEGPGDGGGELGDGHDGSSGSSSSDGGSDHSGPG